MEIVEFIDTYSNNVGSLSHELRSFIKSSAPDSDESLNVGWRVISFGRKKKFCAIAPHSRWVNLQFHNGTALNDPKKLLEGSGKTMRHVKIEVTGDLSADLAALIKQADELAI